MKLVIDHTSCSKVAIHGRKKLNSNTPSSKHKESPKLKSYDQHIAMKLVQIVRPYIWGENRKKYLLVEKCTKYDKYA